MLALADRQRASAAAHRPPGQRRDQRAERERDREREKERERDRDRETERQRQRQRQRDRDRERERQRERGGTPLTTSPPRKQSMAATEGSLLTLVLYLLRV